MNKILISIGCAMLLCIPAGCSEQDSAKAELPKTEETSVAKMKAQEINGLSIQLNNFSTIESGTKDKQKILKITVHLKNKTASPLNYDSLGLEVYNTKGEQLKWYPSTNFGGVLAPQQEISGDSFYESKGEGPYTIKYKDLDKPKDSIEWKNVMLQ
ncbi:DUF4352 domain-containing protein [Listeria booriae]|uniref:DUF4352 domain-containing protein n=1 Tax=Listeria booriae TaxID=1552123 RepID=A0A842AVG4_9LIST|nr:DUF4352 domain-containing protein [Listeria booriae]MBC1796733.1 DUF4352 domain-containing protein [Listeria booriae]MBC1799996.1 DUF4352 domain-containing protein [Listeria booriae]